MLSYRTPEYIVGVDLGQMNDYTAIAVLEETTWVPGLRDLDAPQDEGPTGWLSRAELTPAQVAYWRRHAAQHGRPPDPILNLRHLERMRGEPYTAVVLRIGTLIERLTALGGTLPAPVLIVDATGVGRAVIDLMSERGLRPIAVTIHGGDAISGDGDRELRVPKRELIAQTQVLLQNGRLRISRGLEHATTLVDELKDYRIAIGPTGHDSYNARAGKHDDLVLSLSLAAWWRSWFWTLIERGYAAKERTPVDA